MFGLRVCFFISWVNIGYLMILFLVEEDADGGSVVCALCVSKKSRDKSHTEFQLTMS